jgi:hypothetical protein
MSENNMRTPKGISLLMDIKHVDINKRMDVVRVHSQGIAVINVILHNMALIYLSVLG